MKHTWVIGTVAIAALALSCGSAFADDLSADGKAAAADANQFALDLYARLSAADKENLIFSPYSIDAALAMTSAGARGQTAEQMGDVLHFDLSSGKMHDGMSNLAASLQPEVMADRDGAREAPSFDLVIANALWAQSGLAINSDFSALVKDRYAAELDSLDFAGSEASRESARKTINDWVEKQTHEKIKNLIAPGSLKDSTRLVLTNAIYFKSSWSTPFKKEQTREGPFHSDKPDATASMMHQTHRLGYMENADMQAVELPYQSDRLSMLVLLPRKNDGMSDLEKSLRSKTLDDCLTSLAPLEVELSLPKFTFNSHLGLAQTLQSMGMKDAFGASADFSGITASEKLMIQDVIHQAFIAVDEAGTEAAAATAVTMGMTAMRPPTDKVVFNADHPFVYLIRDNASGAILFMGRVMNPKA